MPFIGNQPSAVPLTSADITDGIIVNADIANSTINLTTKVTGTLPLTNGGTGLSTLGTAAQELRVNSGATALEYYTPTVASSDFVKLATVTASSSASVSFDGYYSSTYDTYIVYGNAIELSANCRLRLRMRRSNADLTGSNYYAAAYGFNQGGSAVDISSVGQGYFDLTDNTGDNTNYRTGIQTIVYSPLSSYNIILKNTSSYYGSDGNTKWIELAGFNNAAQTAQSGLTFYPSAGTITSGTFVLYGVKK